MGNSIATRIYDFLKEYLPFSLLDKGVLRAVSEQVVVIYYQPNEVVFRQGEQPGKYIYIVREGAVHLILEEEGGPTLIEECDEGDVFGIRPLLAAEDYSLTAKIVEESLIYAINIDGFEKVLEENPKVAYYLATSFAAGARSRKSELFKGRLFLDNEHLIDSDFHLTEVQSLDSSKDPVTCSRSNSIREAATIMSEKEVGSIIIVDNKNAPLGIITDKDLRKQVATGKKGLDTPVEEIMSSPVITVPPHMTVADVQIEMIKNQIHHLCITEDGTDQRKVLGVLSEHDLLVIQGNNPAVLLREFKRAESVRQVRQIRERAESLLRKYLYQEVAISFISTIMTEVNDALIRRVINLALRELEEENISAPEVPFCWMALGSQGRGEQLLRTDQDNALVFDNVPEEEQEAVKGYFLQLATKITQMLHQCGFEYCPADMMASNPNWCLSLQEWEDQFSHWIHEPSPEAIMHATIFFDYRPVYGESKLSQALTDHIFRVVEGQSTFLSFLALNALQNPSPLTFFRNFVVERGGEHKDEFDIKARAMMPLADAARVLILNAQVSQINNTFRRFEKMMELEPQNAQLYREAADAYEIFMRYRTLQGLKNGNSGRYFDPSELTKMQRINLRNGFRPIKEIQSLLETRFQTAYLR